MPKPSTSTLQRGWVYGNTVFREQMKLLIAPSASDPVKKQQNDLDKAKHYLKHAQQKWKLQKKEILSKRNSSPEKVALGIIIKEITGLSHRAIAQMHNKGIKAKNDQSASSICYRQLLDASKK